MKGSVLAKNLGRDTSSQLRPNRVNLDFWLARGRRVRIKKNLDNPWKSSQETESLRTKYSNLSQQRTVTLVDGVLHYHFLNPLSLYYMVEGNGLSLSGSIPWSGSGALALVVVCLDLGRKKPTMPRTLRHPRSRLQCATTTWWNPSTTATERIDGHTRIRDPCTHHRCDQPGWRWCPHRQPLAHSPSATSSRALAAALHVRLAV
jgi:hypothetical protein